MTTLKKPVFMRVTAIFHFKTIPILKKNDKKRKKPSQTLTKWAFSSNILFEIINDIIYINGCICFNHEWSRLSDGIEGRAF